MILIKINLINLLSKSTFKFHLLKILTKDFKNLHKPYKIKKKH